MAAVGLISIVLLTGLSPADPPAPEPPEPNLVTLRLPVAARGLDQHDRALLDQRIPFEPPVPVMTPKRVKPPVTDRASHQTASPVPPGPSVTTSAAIDPAAEPRDQAPQATEAQPPPPAQPERRVVEVTRGDSLYTIFKAMGLPPQTMYRVLHAGDEVKRLKRLRPGQVFEFELDGEGELKHLVYRPTDLESVHVVARDDGFDARAVRETLERRENHASGAIDDSLFLSAQRAGLSAKLIMQMVEIFGWDVDFAMDIRAGDRFAVIYEELYKDGERLRDGAILAAEFQNQGRVLRAIRHKDPEGRTRYFTPEGKSMRKAFLRTPVSFARISSRFSLGRKHPVLHRVRAHKGVDYAAPTGTPVKAAGDGKVVHRGRKGGYGKTVILQHGGTYTTLYAHLSRYKRGLLTGMRVQQGDIIGYVGSTGLATGPHLHYEFRVRGTHRNPLTVELPHAEPINPAYLADFRRQAERLVAQIELVNRTQLAANDH